MPARAAAHPVSTAPSDALALAVEAAAGLRPFGLDRIDAFEVRWTHGPGCSSAFVPFRRDDVTMSVMLRLGVP